MNNYMMLYLWEDTDTPETELKFGETWQNAFNVDEAFEQTKKYIRNSLGRQKHKFDEGRVIIHHIWNASEYAVKFDKFKPHSKLDDFIRDKLILGVRVGKTEVHRNISSDEFVVRINKELAKHNQPLPVVGLGTKQFEQLGIVKSALGSGLLTILAEFCARFGKTIWAGSLIRETEAELTVIASYVLTSFSSFIKEFTSFEQFKDFVLVDTKSPSYKTEINQALSQGKQVIAFLSMCTSDKRSERINFLYNRDVDVLTVIDEADYGIQHPSQANLLVQARKKNDPVILMTGTGADRAVGSWNVDYHTSVTYIELLTEKHGLEVA